MSTTFHTTAYLNSDSSQPRDGLCADTLGTHVQVLRKDLDWCVSSRKKSFPLKYPMSSMSGRHAPVGHCSPFPGLACASWWTACLRLAHGGHRASHHSPHTVKVHSATFRVCARFPNTRMRDVFVIPGSTKNVTGGGQQHRHCMRVMPLFPRRETPWNHVHVVHKSEDVAACPSRNLLRWPKDRRSRKGPARGVPAGMERRRVSSLTTEHEHDQHCCPCSQTVTCH